MAMSGGPFQRQVPNPNPKRTHLAAQLVSPLGAPKQRFTENGLGMHIDSWSRWASLHFLGSGLFPRLGIT